MARPTISDTGGGWGWQSLTPVYGTGFGAYGGGYSLTYRLDSNGKISLGGLFKVTGAGVTSTVLTMPVGLRPVTGGGLEEYMPVVMFTTTYTVQGSYWNPSGVVVIPNFPSTVGHWVSLAGISYYIS